jgi:Mg-chelatase subunit ChlD
MQDWAAVGAGSYDIARAGGDIERAFDRMATWLRRPAPYTFSWQADIAPPGSITVALAEGADVRIGGVAVELILDTSGSMDADLGKRKRIDVAKRSLSRLVADSLPEGLPVALRTFKAGTRAKPSCATRLSVKLGPLDKAAMLKRIDRIKIGKGTKTPLAAAIEAAGGDIGGVEGPRIVVLVTDGAETCGGDPEAAVRALVAAGIDTTVNIVGLALDDEGLKEQMASWADAGGGTFVDAQDQAGLSAGIAAALQAPFRVYDAKGALVGDGIVGDAAVTVQPGTYRVEVLSEPPIVIEDVVVAPGSGAKLTVGGEGG